MSREEDVEALERFAAEHGIPALLDHLGLDGLGNEVARLSGEVERLREALDWYRDHSDAKGNYDGEMYGDLMARALSAGAEQKRKAAMKAAGISDEPLNEAQMRRAERRSDEEGWKDIVP